MSQITTAQLEELVLIYKLQTLYNDYVLALDQDNLDQWL